MNVEVRDRPGPLCDDDDAAGSNLLRTGVFYR
jgi:hypothetical protein